MIRVIQTELILKCFVALIIVTLGLLLYKVSTD
jgi:hypothetical protein